jgi:hypothetical protein
LRVEQGGLIRGDARCDRNERSGLRLRIQQVACEARLPADIVDIARPVAFRSKALNSDAEFAAQIDEVGVV